MQVSITDNADRLQGIVKVTARSTGVTGPVEPILNLIVDAGKWNLLRALLVTPTAPTSITGLAVGSGGCIDPLQKYPKEEEKNQVALHTKLRTIPVTIIEDEPNLQLRFLATLTEFEEVGSTISEIGLVTGSGATEKLFNVKNFPGILKGEFALDVEWIVRFA